MVEHSGDSGGVTQWNTVERSGRLEHDNSTVLKRSNQADFAQRCELNKLAEQRMKAAVRVVLLLS